MILRQAQRRLLQWAATPLLEGSVASSPALAPLQQLGSGVAAYASGPKTNINPPPDASRGATADLADVFVPEPVDKVAERKVQIMEPIFRYV